ncbi:MAG TPA: septum formation family protein [Candidatus Limnocylindrales bacterium]|nr:septum formation family protein [Candidatus Limnocylindrales bacterium]
MTDRWVCKRCFADNNETDSACQRCGLIRGAEATPADQTSWAASEAGAATAAPAPGWRRWIRFWWIPALAIALVVGYLTTARRDDAGSLASAGTVSVDDLRAGDCFNTTDDVEISDVDGVPCTEPHQYEVFALATYEGDGTYPPDSQLDAIFTEVCEPAFEPYVGLPWADSDIYGNMISPSEESWSEGDRAFICVLYDPEDEALTESLAGANR